MEKKIDLVYKLGSGCEWENYSELRYSIRSFVKNFKDLGNIYIIGSKPNWITNVIHIPFEDSYKANKDANLINKLIIASLESSISENFLNMSDDNFLLKSLDASFFNVAYFNNKLVEFTPERRLTRWELRLQRTMDILKTRNLPTNCFENHIPTLINKNTFPKIALSYDFGFDNGYCGNTLYFNTLNTLVKPKESSLLSRLEHPPANINFIEIDTIDKIFFNFTTKAFNEHIRSFLEKRFTEKTVYELD